MRDSLWAIRCVWLRYLDVFKKNLAYAMTTTFVEPLLYLASFGFGLGPLIGQVNLDGHPVPYRAFVLSGLVAQTLLFQGFFDAAYGGFIRMYYQKIFKAMATTPITLSEVLWGELIWDASRATMAATAILIIGSVLGDFRPLGALAAIPLCFFGAFCFAGLGLWTAATAHTIESISYPQYLLIIPMFLFCGIYFPLDGLPGPLAKFAWALPLTPAADLYRSLLLGLPLKARSPIILGVYAVILVAIARNRMLKRLVK